ncbi:MAG: hypothetical protein H5T69_14250 [Chloroflexi bacterium]|nr:hypothetical protein [Chloroflexota bacterium]
MRAEGPAHLRTLVHRNLIKIALVELSALGILAIVVRYDLAQRTPWVLHPTITRLLGWLTAIYGLFWVVWWFFWVAIEGGDQTIELYNITWAPVTRPFCTDGPFAWCRYPLAFGYLEFLWGLGFLVQSTTAVLKMVPFTVLIMVLYLRFVVDRQRLRRYGEAYRRYLKATPLFIPRIPDRSVIMHIFRRRKRR